MGKILIITKDNNIKNISCVILAKLCLDADYKFISNNEEASITSSDYSNVYTIDCEKNEKQFINFYSELINTNEYVRTKEHDEPLRILNGDIKEFVKTIETNGKKAKIMESVFEFFGAENFIAYYLDKFKKQKNSSLIINDDEMKINCDVTLKKIRNFTK